MLNSRKLIDEIIEKMKASGYDFNYIIARDYLKNNNLNNLENRIARARAVIDWLLSEYKEPIKLSRLEYEFLKYVKDQGYLYMARDKNEGLCFYKEKPYKSLLNNWWDSRTTRPYRANLIEKSFQFVQWEDEEPTSIETVLNNYEIMEDKQC